MNSFSDYKQGSATAEYRHYVDEAVQIAERQKQRVDPMYHEKIDSLLDTYARKLAANMNKGYEIDARVPSILIAGGSNFPHKEERKSRTQPATAIIGNGRTYKGFLIKSAVPAWAVSAQTTRRQYRS